MFRCLFQSRKTSFTPTWLPSFTSSSCGSRGIKLSRLSAITNKSATTVGSGVRTGKYWLAYLDRNEIGHYRDLKTIKKLSAHGIFFRICNFHARNQTDDIYFVEQGHAYAEAVVRRYVRDHREKPLWVAVKPNPIKPIIKGRFRVRAISAWRQALRNAGYDADGRGLTTPGSGKAGRELFGTVEISSHSPLEIQNVSFEKLRTFMEVAVKNLESQLGRPAAGDVQSMSQGSDLSRMQSQPPQSFQRGGPPRDTRGRRPEDTESHRRHLPWQGRENDSRGSWGSGGLRNPANRSWNGGRGQSNASF